MQLIIKKLLSPFLVTQSKIKTSAQALSQKSIWRDTGNIFYLLETLKLSYHSQHGLVSFENIDLHRLESLLEYIKSTAVPPLTQRVTAGQTACLNITVCGITWQKMGEKLRIKAINEAATLRALQGDFKHSQAIFKHSLYTVDDPISTNAQMANQADVQTYKDISPTQFINQLQQANALLPKALKQPTAISKQNFQQPFSDRESDLLSQGLSSFQGPKVTI